MSEQPVDCTCGVEHLRHGTDPTPTFAQGPDDHNRGRGAWCYETSLPEEGK